MPGIPSALSSSVQSQGKPFFRWNAKQLAILLLGLGLSLRLYYYLGDPSIWFDEAALMVNVLDKSYSELLGPLDNAANGPPLFLWLQKWLVTRLGDQAWVWRLPSLVGSCLSLILFYFIANRVLPSGGLAWAVGLFAFSDRLLWHTVEAKPYTVDTLMAVSAVAAWLWTERWPLVNRLLLFMFLCPLFLCLSYPAVFVCSGLGLVLLAKAWESRRVAIWLSFGLFLVVMGATCWWLLKGPIHAQAQGMRAAGFDWKEHMPDWAHPGKALLWPLKAVFDVLRYCLRPTGGLLIAFWVAGIFWLVRAKQYSMLVLLLTPLLAAMICACLHRYPCGHGRPMLFMTPAVSILLGASIPIVLRRLLGGRAALASDPTHFSARSWRWGARVAGFAVLICALTPMLMSLYRVAQPWPRFDCRGAAEYILATRKPDDMVAITSWDQIYFFRHLDPRRRVGTDTLTAGKGGRIWVTINLAFPGSDAYQESLIGGENGWAVADRKELGLLVILCLEHASTSS